MKELRAYLTNQEWRTCGFVLLSCLVSFLIMCLMLPEVYVFCRYSFIRFSDTGLNYQGVFALLTNFYHGGIELWNSYDQMPYAFQHLVAGIYNFMNIAVAAAYILFHRFFESPAVAFHVIYTLAYHLSAFFLRAFGAYLLATHFTSRKSILFTGCILINTILIPHFHLGLNTNALFSFFPLMTHFMLRFFEKFELNDLLLAITTYTLAAATTPLVSVSYFYLGNHFVLLMCMSWALVKNWNQILKALQKPKVPLKWLRNRFNGRVVLKIALVLFLCLVIILPSAYMLKTNYKDYECDQAHSRFNNMLSIKAYFERSLYFAPKEEFLWRLVDYTRNNWTFSWVYVGYLMVFLLGAGLILSADSRKYIFFGSIFSFWLINSPRMSHSWTDIGHWINALTNPFKFAANTFHMAGALQMCFVMYPLLIIGLEAFYNLVQKNYTADYRRRVHLLIIFLAVFCLWIWNDVDLEIKTYVFRATLGFALLLLFLKVEKYSVRRRALAALFVVGLVFVGDWHGMRVYLKDTMNQVFMKTHRIRNLEKAGYVDLDYRNPEVFPRRLYFSNSFIGQVDNFLQADAIGMQGIYYEYTDFYKYFMPVNNYKPRHKAYAHWPGNSKSNVYYPFELWPGDKDMLNYVARDTRLIFEARSGVPFHENLFHDILNHRWDRQVIMVHDVLPGEIPAEVFKNNLPEKVDPPIADDFKWHIANIALNSAQKSEEHYDAVEYTFPLPKSFPDHLTSTIFTNDRGLLRVFVFQKDQKDQQIELTIAQGRLVAPFTFDVRNMYPDKLSVMLPRDFQPSDGLVHFLFWSGAKAGLDEIWRNENDNFGFNYIASENGWLVLHYPYDDKWKITMDDKPVKFYRVNKSFMGFPITQGEHRILLRYWPNTILRPLIFVSIVFYLLALPAVIGIGMRRERRIEVMVREGRPSEIYDPGPPNSSPFKPIMTNLKAPEGDFSWSSRKLI